MQTLALKVCLNPLVGRESLEHLWREKMGIVHVLIPCMAGKVWNVVVFNDEQYLVES